MRLSEQLHRRGALERVVTGYPRFKLGRYSLPPQKIVSLHTAVPQIALGRMPLIGRYLVPASDYWNRVAFDHLAARYVRGSDVSIVWMHSTPYLLKRAKDEGAIAILECGAVHCGYLAGLLRREYARLGLKFCERNSPILYPRSLNAELAQYEEADYLNVPSEFVRQSFLEGGVPAQKLLKAPYGTDCKTFTPATKVDGVFRVLFVGTLSLLKGVPVLMEAWRRLSWGKGAELALVGRISPELSKMFGMSSPGVRPWRRYDHWELPRVYSQGSVFVFPSWGDGWPLVVGEAMACGLPVICTPNSGACEMIRDGVEGFVVPAGDAEAMAGRLSFLRDHEALRQEMGRAARKRAQYYSWKRYGEQVMENLSAVLTGCRAEIGV
jgi:glycosyltransferase involved in cell wall biosynthesis